MKYEKWIWCILALLSLMAWQTTDTNKIECFISCVGFVILLRISYLTKNK